MQEITFKKSKSLYRHAFDKIVQDKMSCAALCIVVLYAVIGILSATGIIAANWSQEVGPSYAAPASDYLFGTDIFGRSVVLKTIKGIEIAFSIGFVTALLTVLIGTVLGMISGYYGGLVDDILMWFFTTAASIPSIMLMMAIALALGKGILAVYLSLGLTSWLGLYRLIRGEVMRHKDREYVQAASSIGGSDFRKIFKHILPNVSHIMIITFSLTFQGAIKAEVILSYLGLGVQGRPSWGIMIDDAKMELSRGVWWQLTAATMAMFVLVLALSILGDALRDALDPKLKGK